MKTLSTKNATSSSIFCLIYGESSIGKTMLASALKEKTYIISAESGLLALQDYDIPYVDITKGDKDEKLTATEKVARLSAVIDMLQKGTDYKNIFVDSLTEISQIFVEKLQIDYPERKDGLVLWGDYSKYLRYFIKTFRDMSQYNVFMTALDKLDYDDLKRKITTLDLNGKLARTVSQYFDEVFYYRKFQKDDKEVRMLVTDTYDKANAKDRSGRLAQFEKPNLQDIINKIQEVKKCSI